MDFLASGSGVGSLASGCGTMLSYVTKAGTDFTTVIERDFLASPQHKPDPSTRNNASCVEERASFQLGGKLAALTKVAVWLTAMNANATIATPSPNAVAIKASAIPFATTANPPVP